MEKWVDNLLTTDIKHMAARLFGTTLDDIVLLRDFENFVFEYEKDGIEYILRFTHSSHRSFELVEGEIEWIEYLSKNGANVYTPIHSSNDTLAEKIDATDGSFFIVVSFVKALGDHPDSSKYSDNFIVNWGETLGMMHRLTKEFKPSKPRYRRIHWYEDDLFMPERHIPDQYEIVKQKFVDHIAYLKKLPQDRDSYGLIHTDAHQGNIIVKGDKLKVIDFDDASYKWFMSDIAIVVYYGTWMKDATRDKRSEFVNYFLPLLLEGYVRENKLEQLWMDEMDNLLRLRDFTLFSVLNKKIDNLPERLINNMKKIGKRLQNDIPPFDVDFTNFKFQ